MMRKKRKKRGVERREEGQGVWERGGAGCVGERRGRECGRGEG